MRTVSIWSSRFEKAGLDGLADKGGQGRKPSLPEAKVARVITEATRPPKGRSRWSVRSMGRHVGISPSTVQRIWAKNAHHQDIQVLERSKIRGRVQPSSRRVDVGLHGSLLTPRPANPGPRSPVTSAAAREQSAGGGSSPFSISQTRPLAAELALPCLASASRSSPSAGHRSLIQPH